MGSSVSRTAVPPASRFFGSRVLASVLAASLLAGPLPLFAADAPAREAHVTSLVANVRATASPSGKVLFQLKQGDVAQVTETSGRWYHIVDKSGRTGYVFATLVTVSDAAPAPAAASAEPAAAAVAGDSSPLKIEHDAIGCIVAEQYPKLDACFLPADSLGRAQIHFRAVDTDPWYAVDLKKDGTCFSALLPKPMSSTHEIQYYVDAIDHSFAEKQQPATGPQGAYHVRVVKKEGECTGVGRLAAFVGKTASPILVAIARDPAGKAVEAAAAGGLMAAAKMAGFSHAGVLTAGPATAGAATTAGTPSTSGGSAAATAGGISSKTLLIAGAAVAVAGVAVVAGGGGGGSNNGSSGSGPTVTTPPHPVTVTGIWAFSLRCQGQTTVVAQSNISLNQTSGGAYNGTAPGTDYNGTAFTLNLTGDYTSTTGVLNGVVSAVFTDTTRVDNFTTTLSSTDTGFIPTTCTQNCGCPGEIRFNRLN